MGLLDAVVARFVRCRKAGVRSHRLPLSRHTLRLGVLSGPYLGGDDIAGARQQKNRKRVDMVMEGLHAA
jgi:hypothetical protein